jgi:hypothetical protein
VSPFKSPGGTPSLDAGKVIWAWKVPTKPSRHLRPRIASMTNLEQLAASFIRSDRQPRPSRI